MVFNGKHELCSEANQFVSLAPYAAAAIRDFAGCADHVSVDSRREGSPRLQPILQ